MGPDPSRRRGRHQSGGRGGPIFGPVLSVIPFNDEDEDEAVALANDSNDGLAGDPWTGNLRRALRLPSQLQVGTV